MSVTARASSLWHQVTKLRGRIPLRAKLIAAELVLVAIALAVISVAGIHVMRGYLLGQQDQAVQAQADSGVLETNVQNYLDADFSGGAKAHHISTAVSADWVADGSGRVYHLLYPISGYTILGFPKPVSGPSYSTHARWLQTRAPVIVGAESGSGHWDVVGMSMAALTPSRIIDGTLVVGVNVSSVYQTVSKLTSIDIGASAILLAGALVAGFVGIRRSMRPLTEIKLTADAINAGDMAQRVPELDPRTEFGSLGRSLNRMLGHIETTLHARSSSEHAARRSEERMRRLLADVSHELRVPLTALHSVAEYYRHRTTARTRDFEPAGRLHSDAANSGNGNPAGRGGAGTLAPADLEKIICRVEQESGRMTSLVEDMLLLTRVDQDGLPDVLSVDLQVIAEDAAAAARVAAPDRGIDLSIDASTALIVNGDAARLRELIGNLLSNALSRAPDGTGIDVRIKPASRAELPGDQWAGADPDPGPAPDPDPGPAPAPDPDPGTAAAADTARAAVRNEPSVAVVEVTDYGPRLTEDQTWHAFERTYRADRAQASAGSGLGLPIVAALAKAHGGTAWVGPGLGHGSTFCVALPLASAMPLPVDDEQPAAADVEDLFVASPQAGEAGYGGMSVTGVSGSAPAPGSTWIQPDAVDEVSFLDIRRATPPALPEQRPACTQCQTGTHARARDAAGAAGRDRASRRPAGRSPDNLPGSGRGTAPRTSRASPGPSRGVRHARPRRSASPGRLTTTRSLTSSRHGSGPAARPVRQGRRSGPRPPRSARRRPRTTCLTREPAAQTEAGGEWRTTQANHRPRHLAMAARR